MATYRQVHISFWQDGFVLGLTPEEKYFYLYLMTNSKTTQCGIYELPKRVIEMETGYNRDTVEKLLDRFIKYRKIDYCEITQEIIILNWIKHNSINSPKVKACIAKELKTVKHNAFKRSFYHLCKRYGYPIDSLSIDLGEEEEKEDIYICDENPHDKRIRQLMLECKIKGAGIDGFETIRSYVGQVDFEVIEKALKKSENKNVNYFISVINGFIEDGKTTKESIHPLQVVPRSREPKREFDRDLEARRREIAFNKWVAEGKDPSDFVYEPA